MFFYVLVESSKIAIGLVLLLAAEGINLLPKFYIRYPVLG